ncbi:MAG: hypothetical protein FVQ80_11950 [Planctomycetes bacterium]|nr:hypothetical protein [Planctomycetota bacterium]
MREWVLLDRVIGILFLFAGISLLLRVYGIYPRKPNDSEEVKMKLKKYGKLYKIIGIIFVLLGLVHLLLK